MKLEDFFGGHPLNLFPRVRKDDPVTSYEAADKIKNTVPEHYNKIIECLNRHGALGKDGISNNSYLDPNQVARRLSEMERLGYIRQTGNKVKSNTGRNEREWQICVK
jgi:predicted transcriptional regulator